ncbi:MAG TPA: TonB-dependent receptor [Thermoanaerobaculia bacterium]|nr:TonB-dependent receptor [Thermoanaerobaculia bacterium]
MLKSVFRTILFTASLGAFAQAPDLAKLDVGDLMNVEVTSVARRGQKIADTPAAVFVITQEDIQRSGATTIAEVLRIVPGLDVASVDGNIWAISARGFNDRWSNKTLVLIDGRSAYSPLFSGVYWDIQDTNLEDIDRIEVIRGPGGTLWGTNGAYGTINIITKNAIETQGVSATLGGGTTERSFASLRYGSGIGDNFHFRVFAKSYDRDATTRDSWHGGRAGFRADWMASPSDNITFESELYRGSSEEMAGLFAPSDPLHGPWHLDSQPGGAGITLKWTQTQSTRSETTLQVYGDYAARLDSLLDERRRAYDIDFQHRISATPRNELVWGAGYRRNIVHATSSHELIDLPHAQSEEVLSAFVQDEIRLPHNVNVTLGAKLQYEHDDGAQIQPTLRVLWHPSEHQSVWAAATRAVRNPGWIEQNGTINLAASAGEGGVPSEVILYPNPEIEPESENTFELGYRREWSDRFTVDVTTYHEHLAHVINMEADGVPHADAAGQRVIVPLRWRNDDSGHAYGFELFTTARITDRWDATAGLSLLDLHNRHAGTDDAQLFGSSPKRQLQLRNIFELTPRLELDMAAYYVSRLEAQHIPAYLRVDALLAWHLNPAVELSVAGQNLFDERHSEFTGDDPATSVPIKRSVYGKVTWRF